MFRFCLLYFFGNTTYKSASFQVFYDKVCTVAPSDPKDKKIEVPIHVIPAAPVRSLSELMALAAQPEHCPEYPYGILRLNNQKD
ncbi:hypothetical protein WH95_00740 [Kiloniella litopenaei]|uniref:Uncharacterized protein n=1 Tax=Kiloniella litopenaei TaxID=1549748 RepID=A0A0M2RAG8_9PROT|nr:hypothetical protein WH95_00740 [Kiloniella litopenaei]